MTLQNDESGLPIPEADWPRNGLWLGLLVLGLVGAVLIGTAIFSAPIASAAGSWFGHEHRRWGHGGGHDPEQVRDHAERAAGWFSDHIDASDEQSEQIRAIVVASVDDFMAQTDEHRGHRDAFVAALVGDTIDRAELERIRSAELALAEDLSRTLVSSLADLAEVLTPEQRAELAELREHFRGGHRRHGRFWH